MDSILYTVLERHTVGSQLGNVRPKRPKPWPGLCSNEQLVLELHHCAVHASNVSLCQGHIRGETLMTGLQVPEYGQKW